MVREDEEAGEETINTEVKETYRKMHTYQTVDFVREKVGYSVAKPPFVQGVIACNILYKRQIGHLIILLSYI